MSDPEILQHASTGPSRLSRRTALTAALGALAGTAVLGAPAAASLPVRSGPAGPGPRPWAQRAAAAVRGLDRHYGAPWPQLLHNTTPSSSAADEQFHYWWLAHAVDVRLDAHRRTGRRADLQAAEEIAEAIRHRNDGSLFNDFFDDMLWYALALERLWQVTRNPSHLQDAVALWEEVVTAGWNDAYGPSVAWQRNQLDYKNTPSNAPFAILGYRLHRITGAADHLTYADATMDWMRETLVDPETGFVADGINREGNGAIDWDWRFTYCQGVWAGALVEADTTHAAPGLLEDAVLTTRNAIADLTSGTVFASEGQGDGGLFKGIWYRYAWQLREALAPGADRDFIDDFLRVSTDTLWAHSFHRGVVLAGPDWRESAPRPLDLSTQLSGIMALEVRSLLDR